MQLMKQAVYLKIAKLIEPVTIFSVKAVKFMNSKIVSYPGSKILVKAIEIRLETGKCEALYIIGSVYLNSSILFGY